MTVDGIPPTIPDLETEDIEEASHLAAEALLDHIRARRPSVVSRSRAHETCTRPMAATALQLSCSRGRIHRRAASGLQPGSHRSTINIDPRGFGCTHMTMSTTPETSAAAGELQGTARGARNAILTFVGLETVALGLWMYLGRTQWFFSDEWDFLAGRTAGDVDSLFHGHGAIHWSTLPVLVYRLLWQLFGIRTYRPYQLCIVMLHLGLAALLRVVMRRCGVRPWIATVAASTFAFFGAGWENIIWAFQIGFVGSVVFGLVQLLLADRDGPLGRRDVLALFAGLASLMCSGVGVSMTLMVGFAVLVRRGWRAALVHTAPLAVVYLLWATHFDNTFSSENPPSVGAVLRFTASGIGATFDALGQLPGVGLVLGIMLIVGLAVTWAPLDVTCLRRQAAVPAALLVGAGGFYVITGTGRAGGEAGVHFGNVGAPQSRWVYVAAALLVPAMAVALEGIAQRWRGCLPLVVAVLVVGVPGNIRTLMDHMHHTASLQRGMQELIETAASSPQSASAPAWVQPLVLAPWVTTGWLVAGARSGRISRVDVSRRARTSTLTLTLLESLQALQQFTVPATYAHLHALPGYRGLPPPGECHTLHGWFPYRFETGAALSVRGSGRLWVYLVDGETASRPLILGSYPDPQAAVVASGPLNLLLVPIGPVSLCTT